MFNTGPTDVRAQRTQLRHADAVIADHIDAAEQGDVSFHTNGGGACPKLSHAVIGLRLPHSGQDVAAYSVAQWGQMPRVAKVSNDCRHLLQRQKSPAGGAI